MNLNEFLMELATERFSPRNGMVSKKAINDKLKANNYDIDVASKEKQFEYNDGNGKVPLECTKDANHTLKYNGKISFDKLEDYLKKKAEICNTCADDKKVATTGTSNSELEFKDALQKYITDELGCNVTIYSGSNKAKTEYRSKSGKRNLDYDIKISDNADNTKTFTISILGPSHNAFNQDVNTNDAIRAVEEYRRGRSFIVSPAFRKGTKLFEDQLEKMKFYIRTVYNRLTPPEESKKAKKLERRFGRESAEYKTHIEEKNKRITQRLKNVDNSAIQQQLTNILTALRTNIGPENTKYRGKYGNILDYINNEGDKVIKSYSLHKDEWDKLLTANKKEFDDWVIRNQAISDFDKSNYYKRTAQGNPKSRKLFENRPVR